MIRIPNYDYKCRKCDGEFEKNVPIEERDTIVCDCGGETFRKIVFYGRVWSPTRNGATS